MQDAKQALPQLLHSKSWNEPVDVRVEVRFDKSCPGPYFGGLPNPAAFCEVGFEFDFMFL